MKQSIILGNIITMDEKRPFAKAALVKNGVFAFIGSAEEVKQIASRGARVLDYGDNFIYPGFIESHSHGYFAGDRLIGQANLKTRNTSPRRIWMRYIRRSQLSCKPVADTPCCSIPRLWNG